MCGGNAPSESCASNEELIRLRCRPTRDTPHVSILRPAQKLSGGRVTLQTRRRVNGKRPTGRALLAHHIMPTASFVKFSVDSHMMTIESWAHMGDLTRKFRAHAYTSVWLERLKRCAKYRRWDAVTVPGKEACQGSRWNGPEGAHALAHQRCHRPC